jgi:RNA polymerase sigma-70 factor (ECF subfamily)
MLPSGLGGPSDDPTAPLAERRSDVPWLQPLPESAMRGDAEDPAAIASRRESTRLAFVAALQQLPPRQRAALVLCDVLAWPAADTADLLDLSVAAVTSALQRARAQLARSQPSQEVVTMTSDIDAQLLDRFVVAFETADLRLLSELLRRDVELEMPPIPTWFAGRDAVAGFFANRVLSRGRIRMSVTSANGCPAVGSYSRGADGRFNAHSIQVLETRDGAIAHIYAFLDVDLFAAFGLPLVHADQS